MTDPIELIGCSIDDPFVERFLAQHGGPHVIDEPDPDLPGRRSVTAVRSGVELSIADNGAVQVVFLYLHGNEDRPEFNGRLPLGLSSEFTQSDVRRVLGRPHDTRPPLLDPVLGSYGPSDRYDFSSHSVHLQYAATTGALVLVTVMAPSIVPRST